VLSGAYASARSIHAPFMLFSACDGAYGTVVQAIIYLCRNRRSPSLRQASSALARSHNKSQGGLFGLNECSQSNRPASGERNHKPPATHSQRVTSGLASDGIITAQQQDGHSHGNTVEVGAAAVALPIGDYVASLTDPQLQVLFVSQQRSSHSAQHCKLSTVDAESVAFRVTESLPQPPATLNRFNYLPHSHTVDDIYTDNTARAFVGRGGAANLTTMHCHDIYTRRRPRIWV
jgi:hypothetical protein